MPVKKSGLGKGLDSLIPNKKENKDISPRFDKKKTTGHGRKRQRSRNHGEGQSG